MVAEPTTSQPLDAPPATDPNWARVLGIALSVLLGAGIAGFFCGGVLNFALVTWLAGPEAVMAPSHDFSGLPPAAQALASEDGLFLLVFLFMAPIGIALLVLAVPRSGPTAREYLGLKWPGLRQGLTWTLLLLAVQYGYRSFVVHGLKMPWSQDDSFEKIAGVPLFFPLTFVTLAVLFPVFMELLFRGFLVEGLRRSQLGVLAAILLPATLWAAMGPNSPVHAVGLFYGGVLLGLARLQTGSTYPGILAHVVMNAVAVLSWANA